MTKKKSSLWLHRPKRRSLPRHTFFSQLCRKLPPEILNDLYESSQQNGRKHKCTPLKGTTPKRKILLSPGTPSSISGSYDTVVAKLKKLRRRLVEIAREYTLL